MHLASLTAPGELGSRTARKRAASRAVLASVSYKNIARPNSVMPNTRTIRSGRQIASSSIATPRCLRKHFIIAASMDQDRDQRTGRTASEAESDTRAANYGRAAEILHMDVLARAVDRMQHEDACPTDDRYCLRAGPARAIDDGRGDDAPVSPAGPKLACRSMRGHGISVADGEPGDRVAR